MSAASNEQKPAGAGRAPWRMREKALLAIAVLCAIAAIAGFALFAHSSVPTDAAAKVDGEYLMEDELAAYINESRISSQTTDDTDFARYLLQQNLNVSTFRQNCINQLLMYKIIDRRAAELGVTPSDDEVAEQVASLKDSMAFADDDIWQDTLEEQGMTEDEIRNRVRSNIAQQKIFEADVEKRDATDDEVLDYAKTLAGQTLKHSYRIVFDSSKNKEAHECYEKLQEIGKTTTVDTFSAFAAQYSTDENASSDGGSFGWSNATDMPTDYLEVLDGLEEGQYSDPNHLDDGIVIVFCDESFTFPDSSDIDTFKLSDLSEQLRPYIADCAADKVWDAECQVYLTQLLSTAKITYYPIPDDAEYNVSLLKAYDTDE